jgi:hypothetical protein
MVKGRTSNDWASSHYFTRTTGEDMSTQRYFDDSLRERSAGPANGHSHTEPAAQSAAKHRPNVNELAASEWSELPYAMMRLTEAKRPWDGNHLYWRDRNVQLGEVYLNLAAIEQEAAAPTYLATFVADDLRRDFALLPALDCGELRWTAPDISGPAKLTTPQLAERLLSKLVTFYTSGLT